MGRIRPKLDPKNPQLEEQRGRVLRSESLRLTLPGGGELHPQSTQDVE